MDIEKIEKEIYGINQKITIMENDLKDLIDIIRSKLSETNSQYGELINELEKISNIDKRLSGVETFLNRRRGFIKG